MNELKKNYKLIIAYIAYILLGIIQSKRDSSVNGVVFFSIDLIINAGVGLFLIAILWIYYGGKLFNYKIEIPTAIEYSGIALIFSFIPTIIVLLFDLDAYSTIAIVFSYLIFVLIFWILSGELNMKQRKRLVLNVVLIPLILLMIAGLFYALDLSFRMNFVWLDIKNS